MPERVVQGVVAHAGVGDLPRVYELDEGLDHLEALGQGELLARSLSQEDP